VAYQKSHEQFVLEVYKIHRNKVRVLGKYKGHTQPVKFGCPQGHIWNKIAGYVLDGTGCVECNKAVVAKCRRKTHRQFVEEVRQAVGDLHIFVGKYVTAKQKIEVKCKNCDYLWDSYPIDLIRASCPQCSKVERGKKRKWTHEFFTQKLKDQHGERYEALTEYQGKNHKLLFRCNNGHTWKAVPYSVLRERYNCPYCKVVKYSKVSIKCLDHLSKRLGLKICHAENNGEALLPTGDISYRVDGYNKRYQIAFEFNGSYWHKRPEVIARDRRKLRELKRAGYRVITIWEHEWERNPDKCVGKVLSQVENIRCH
jgi:transcription elongation factor Elf1